MPRINHEKPGLVYACPACDGTIIYERTGNGNTAEHPERPYRCQTNGCGVPLNYIIVRPKKGNTNHGQQTITGKSNKRTILSREIEAMEPEDAGLNPIGVRGGAD